VSTDIIMAGVGIMLGILCLAAACTLVAIARYLWRNS